MLNVVVLITFLVGVVGLFFINSLSKFQSLKFRNTNPQFTKFQKIYFLALFPALLADWLNAPYLYKLFTHYGFLEEQIVIIYISGLLSALIFGTFSNLVIDKYGHIKVATIFSATYAVGCFLKLSSDYSTLIISRVICGASTALLFAAHEAWYNEGHAHVHDFPMEWISETLSLMSFASNLLAIIAGITAYLLSELIGLGPVTPSILAVPFLMFSAAMVWTRYGKTKVQTFEHDLPTETAVKPTISTQKKPKFSTMCLEGIRNIAQNPDLLNIGCVQALYESVLCIFVFLWTPVLDHHQPALGIVFASLMTAALCGDTIYKSFLSKQALTLSGSLLLACVGILMCVLSTSPTNEFPTVSYLAFLLVEISVGIYFPAMSAAKKKIKPELQNVAVTAIFRVPLTLLACCGLMILHESTNAHGTRKLFIFCFVMVAIAAVLSIQTTRNILKSCKNENNETEKV